MGNAQSQQTPASWNKEVLLEEAEILEVAAKVLQSQTMYTMDDISICLSTGKRDSQEILVIAFDSILSKKSFEREQLDFKTRKELHKNRKHTTAKILSIIGNSLNSLIWSANIVLVCGFSDGGEVAWSFAKILQEEFASFFTNELINDLSFLELATEARIELPKEIQNIQQHGSNRLRRLCCVSFGSGIFLKPEGKKFACLNVIIAGDQVPKIRASNPSNEKKNFGMIPCIDNLPSKSEDKINSELLKNKAKNITQSEVIKTPMPTIVMNVTSKNCTKLGGIPYLTKATYQPHSKRAYCNAVLQAIPPTAELDLFSVNPDIVVNELLFQLISPRKAVIHCKGANIEYIYAILLHRPGVSSLTCYRTNLTEGGASFSVDGWLQGVGKEIDIELLSITCPPIIKKIITPENSYALTRTAQIANLEPSNIVDLLYTLWVNSVQTSTSLPSVKDEKIIILDSLLSLVSFESGLARLNELESDNQLQSFQERKLLKEALRSKEILCCKQNRSAFTQLAERLLEPELDTLPTIRCTNCFFHAAFVKETRFSALIDKHANDSQNISDPSALCEANKKFLLENLALFAMRINLIKHHLNQREKIKVRRITGPRSMISSQVAKKFLRGIICAMLAVDEEAEDLNSEQGIDQLTTMMLAAYDRIHQHVFPLTWGSYFNLLGTLVGRQASQNINPEYKDEGIDDWHDKLLLVANVLSIFEFASDIDFAATTNFSLEYLISHQFSKEEPTTTSHRKKPKIWNEKEYISEYPKEMDKCTDLVKNIFDAMLKQDKIDSEIQLKALRLMGRWFSSVVRNCFGPYWEETWLPTLLFYFKMANSAEHIYASRSLIIEYPITLGIVGVAQSGKSTLCKIAFDMKVKYGENVEDRTSVPTQHSVALENGKNILVIDFPGSDDFGEAGEFFNRGYGLGAVLIAVIRWNSLRYIGSVKLLAALSSLTIKYRIFVTMADIEFRECDENVEDFQEFWNELISETQSLVRDDTKDDAIDLSDTIFPACLDSSLSINDPKWELYKSAGILSFQDIKQWCQEQCYLLQ